MVRGNRMQNPTHLAIPHAYFWKETDKAYCFRLETEKPDEPRYRFINLPKSRIRDYQIINGICDFWIEEWLIGENNIQEFIDTSYMLSLF